MLDWGPLAWIWASPEHSVALHSWQTAAFYLRSCWGNKQEWAPAVSFWLRKSIAYTSRDGYVHDWDALFRVPGWSTWGPERRKSLKPWKSEAYIATMSSLFRGYIVQLAVYHCPVLQVLLDQPLNSGVLSSLHHASFCAGNLLVADWNTHKGLVDVVLCALVLVTASSLPSRTARAVY